MNAITAYALLKDIPEENFIENYLTNYHDSCCVFGHLLRITSPNFKDYGIENCFPGGDDERTIAINRFVRKDVDKFFGQDLTRINNAPSVKFPQETPKQRVLVALTEMMQDKKEESIIHYHYSWIDKLKTTKIWKFIFE